MAGLVKGFSLFEHQQSPPAVEWIVLVYQQSVTAAACRLPRILLSEIIFRHAAENIGFRSFFAMPREVH